MSLDGLCDDRSNWTKWNLFRSLCNRRLRFNLSHTARCHYHRTGFKCVVKWLRFRNFEEIVFLIIVFVVCDRLGHYYQMYIIACFKDCNPRKNSKFAIFRPSHLKPVLRYTKTEAQWYSYIPLVPIHSWSSSVLKCSLTLLPCLFSMPDSGWAGSGSCRNNRDWMSPLEHC